MHPGTVIATNIEAFVGWSIIKEHCPFSFFLQAVQQVK